jgi:hypothetical protein
MAIDKVVSLDRHTHFKYKRKLFSDLAGLMITA